MVVTPPGRAAIPRVPALIAARAAGRRAAATLPDISPECARRIAALLREPVNEFVREQRNSGQNIRADRMTA